MTPMGIEPATLRLVAQCLNHLRHLIHLYPHKTVYKFNKARLDYKRHKGVTNSQFINVDFINFK